MAFTFDLRPERLSRLYSLMKSHWFKILMFTSVAQVLAPAAVWFTKRRDSPPLRSCSPCRLLGSRAQLLISLNERLSKRYAPTGGRRTVRAAPATLQRLVRVENCAPDITAANKVGSLDLTRICPLRSRLLVRPWRPARGAAAGGCGLTQLTPASPSPRL